MSATRRVALRTARLDADHAASTAPSASSSRRRRRLVNRALIASDVVAVLTGFVLAYAITGPTDNDRPVSVIAAFVACTAAAFVLSAKAHGLYGRDIRHPEHSTVEEIVPILQMVTLTTWLALIAGWLIGVDWHIDGVAVFWLTVAVAVPLARTLGRALVRRRQGYVQRALIVGAGNVGQLIGRKLKQHPELGIDLVGFVDTDPREMRADLPGIPVIVSIEQGEDLAERHDVERVIVAFSREHHDQMLPMVRRLQNRGVQVDVVPRLFEAVGPAVEVHSIEGLTLVGIPPVRISRTARVAKRCIDVVVASVVLLFTGPLLLVIAWRIRRGSDGPVLFRQTRLGENGDAFTMFKFRTMKVDTDDAPHREYVKEIMASSALPNASSNYKLDRPEALTKVGDWLRRTSLDELPQLLNVLRGDMSLVGPRPCLPYEVELFLPHHFDRFLVPAGMTGLWQVSARANTTFGEALDLDASYARNWSFWLDFSLLARTPVAVIRGRHSTS